MQKKKKKILSSGDKKKSTISVFMYIVLCLGRNLRTQPSRLDFLQLLIPYGVFELELENWKIESQQNVDQAYFYED